MYEPYNGNVPDDWQHHIVDIIVATEHDLPNRHLISLNVANGRKKVENPHPAVSIFNFHYCVPPDARGLTHSGGPHQLRSPKFSGDIALRIVAMPGSNASSN